MLLAALQGVDKYYGEQTVLAGVNLELRSASRCALIGRNGAGKSTILKLLLGAEEADTGRVHLGEDVTVAMLAQDPVIEPGKSVLAYAEDAFIELNLMDAQLRGLEQQGLSDPDTYHAWEHLHEVFTRRGGLERRARRDAVLFALGFRGREQQEASQLSGGEKTRLGLAKILMAQPDVLLLDEPTNHLDIAMRDWLGGYLARYPGAVLLVSHDRAFLDETCDVTAEIRGGVLRSMNLPPSQYRDARLEQERLDALTRANEQKEHERLQASATQMKQWAGQNAKLHRRAKAMERRVERYAAGMLADDPFRERSLAFSFPCEGSGELVLQAEHLSQRFGVQLFKDVGFTLRQGERVALVGPNGAGKSSLLRLILGESASADPRASLRFGSRVRVGYYDQNLSGFAPGATLLEELIRLVGDKEAHNLLGRFMFPYDAQYKQIAALSGGERARLALLKLTLGEYNFLVLDEPTNHLDVEMIEALEDALKAYGGTLLLISHDRRFIAETSERIWELENGVFTAYDGDWFYYLQQKRRLAAEAANDESTAQVAPKLEAKPKGPSKWQLTQDIAALEAEIEGLERELEEVQGRLERPETLSADDLITVSHDHDRLEAKLLDVMAAWEEASRLLAQKEEAAS